MSFRIHSRSTTSPFDRAAPKGAKTTVAAGVSGLPDAIPGRMLTLDENLQQLVWIENERIIAFNKTIIPATSLSPISGVQWLYGGSEESGFISRVQISIAINSAALSTPLNDPLPFFYDLLSFQPPAGTVTSGSSTLINTAGTTQILKFDIDKNTLPTNPTLLELRFQYVPITPVPETFSFDVKSVRIVYG